ncbi:STAS domain-containing protein [candidate division KSB1 bacterium]|nr:STAS domain-containing protein [candidate division KSB1 bacterium]
MRTIIKHTAFRDLRNSVRSWAIRFFFSILITLGLSSHLIAQYNDLTFEQISIEQGLSQSIVFCIVQDRGGFMWFGTEDGLNKYDGYDFTVIRTRMLVMDFRQVRWINSTGIGVIIACLNALRDRGGDIRFANLHDATQQYFHISKLETVVRVFDGIDKAVASFALEQKA